MAALLGVALIVPAAAQSRYSRGGDSTPTPTPPPAPADPTPPPSTPPPPAPPPAPVYSTPLLLGQSSSQTPTLGAVFSALSSQIANYNNSNPYDLSQASLSGAKQTVVTPSSTSQASTSSSTPTSGSRYSRGGATPTPPPEPTTPTGPTSISIDVTGWSYLVLQWGDTNYHFYVGDATGVKTFSSLAPLSSYTFFASSTSASSTSVPESLPTLSALGLAAALMGAAARRWGRKP